MTGCRHGCDSVMNTWSKHSFLSVSNSTLHRRKYIPGNVNLVKNPCWRASHPQQWVYYHSNKCYDITLFSMWLPLFPWSTAALWPHQRSVFVHWIVAHREIHNWSALELPLLRWHTMTKKQIEKKRCFLAFSHHCFSPKELRNSSIGGSWSQELMQRPWRVLLTGFLPMSCSACCLIETRTSSPGMTPHTIGWVLPHCSLLEKQPYSWISWRHFLNWCSFLSD